MSFRSSWIETMHRTATGSQKRRTILTPVGLLIFFIALAVIIALSLGVDWLLGFPKLFGGYWNLISGLPVLAIGLFFVLWSNWHFLRVKGTPVPFNPPPKLVTTGPYAYARNPMVTGVLVVLFGLGLLLKSISLTFIFTPLFVLFNAWELKAIEEPELEQRLGKEYVEYKKRVPMFFPWVKVRAKNP
jgi:protein-S-isoprenylcysteine O-methyltransferase Ste14